MEQGEREKGRHWDLTDRIIGALIEVHRVLGPGLLESTYEACVVRELASRGLRVERQRPVPVVYKGALIDFDYRLDLVVGGRILVELKAVERLLPIHVAQVMTYMRLTGLPIGLLVNFNVRVLADGLRRLRLDSCPSLSPSLPVHPFEDDGSC